MHVGLLDTDGKEYPVYEILSLRGAGRRSNPSGAVCIRVAGTRGLLRHFIPRNDRASELNNDCALYASGGVCQHPSILDVQCVISNDGSVPVRRIEFVFGFLIAFFR